MSRVMSSQFWLLAMVAVTRMLSVLPAVDAVGPKKYPVYDAKMGAMGEDNVHSAYIMSLDTAGGELGEYQSQLAKPKKNAVIVYIPPMDSRLERYYLCVLDWGLRSKECKHNEMDGVKLSVDHWFLNVLYHICAYRLNVIDVKVDAKKDAGVWYYTPKPDSSFVSWFRRSTKAEGFMLAPLGDAAGVSEGVSLEVLGYKPDYEEPAEGRPRGGPLRKEPNVEIRVSRKKVDFPLSAENTITVSETAKEALTNALLTDRNEEGDVRNRDVLYRTVMNGETSRGQASSSRSRAHVRPTQK